MLYVFHGTNTDVSRKKAHSLIDTLWQKRPDATFVTIDAEHWSIPAVEENIGGQGLFSSKYIVFLDRVTENVEAKESIGTLLADMNLSPNIFIMFENKLNAELKKTVDKNSSKIINSDIAVDKRPIRNEFNIFAMADALGARNAFMAWSIYRQALDMGNEPESIVGTLFWQVKSMILAVGAKSASEAGLNPFVYSKAKKAAQNYSPEERSWMLRELVSMYHDGHRGVRDLEISTERMLLSITREGRLF